MCNGLRSVAGGFRAQRTEFAGHERITKEAAIDVFFLTHTTHGRVGEGKNENTDRLLRQDYPEKTSFAASTPIIPQVVVDEINTKP